MPRKYTRRTKSDTPVDTPASSVPSAGPVATVLDQAPAIRVLSALEEYGLWLKQNQHITNVLPPEPTKPRKGLAHVQPRRH